MLYTFERQLVVVNVPRHVEWTEPCRLIDWDEPYILCVELDDAIEASTNDLLRFI